jgi:hypothetical protein
MRVTASPHTARAHAVRLTFTLRYRMRCGYPGGGPLVLTFPSALKLPKRFAAGAVRLARRPIPAKVDGRNATVTIPAPTSTLCNVIAPGSLTLTFTRAATLVNPARTGSYRFRATHAGHTFTGKLVIGPAA